MLIREFEYTDDNGKRILRINFSQHKAVIFSSEIPLEHARCSALRIAKAKEQAIEDFLNTYKGKSYTEKEVLKAYSKIDEYFKDVYKEKYPHGGWRNGGRPKGTTTSDKTERFTQAITLEEKKFLTRALEEFRKNKEK